MRRRMFITMALLCLLSSKAAFAQPTCTLNVNPQTGISPLSVTASGLCTSPENNITLPVFLDWGDGTIVPVNPGFYVNHRYNSSGTFKVVVTAFDANGLSGSASQTVKVSPPLQCSPQATPAGGKAPLAVTIAANCTDPDGTPNIVMQFGDSYYQSGPTANHTYVSGGNFRAVVTAKDAAGNAYVGTVSITVTATPSLFVGMNNGQVKQFGKDGSSMGTLNTNLGGSTTGMAFDAFSHLYVTDFTANAVSKFTGSNAASFGSGYNCKPESIVFDHAGNAYVGETGCSHAIVKLDPYGTITAVYQPAVEQQGTDWIDLASDECTIYYTSQGSSVLRFNACSGQQLPPFTTQLTEGLALRILPDGSVIVANLTNIKHFDAGGKPLQTYDAPGEDCWSSLALDSDGTSFWATDYCTSDVVRFDISSGAMISKFNAGVPANSVFGVQTFVPPQTTAAGALVASPGSASVSPGRAASYSLTFTPVGAAVGQQFTFSCGNLPAGATCTLSPASATVEAGGVTTTVTINTSTGTTALFRDHKQRTFWFALLLPGLPLLFFGGQSRRGRIVVVVLALLLAGVLLNCGGGSAAGPPAPNSNSTTPPSPSNGATAAGTYTVLVHAQSGSQASSTTVQLTVQ